MASFNFTVDTSPMANEMQSVSHGVNRVSGAVVAMRAAVIAAEQEGADHVCQNVNKGFYSLMHSQISQKIAQLTSTVEAKLLELGQYAAALKGIQSRMTNDYNMISGRYSKLFKSLNINLESRVAELDMPVFKLVDRDMKLVESRMRLNSAQFTVHQLESVLSSQLLAASKVKVDAESTLEAITQYVKDASTQTRKSEASMQDTRIDSVEDIFLPVSIVESTSAVGNPSVNYYVARSGNPEIDKNIDASVREQSVNSVLNGTWSEIDPNEMAHIEAEFTQLLLHCTEDERVKDEITKMFNRTSDVQQLNPETDEL